MAKRITQIELYQGITAYQFPEFGTLKAISTAKHSATMEISGNGVFVDVHINKNGKSFKALVPTAVCTAIIYEDVKDEPKGK